MKCLAASMMFLAAMVLAGASGCASNSSDNDTGQSPGAGSGDAKTIKIVSSMPRTGSAKGLTDPVANAIKMAIEEADHKAGDFTIVYEDWDDATAAAGNWAAEAEQANAEKAAADPDVMVYLGPFNSGAASISMPILNKVDMLMISPTNTSPSLTKEGFDDTGVAPGSYRPTGRINYTRVAPTDDRQGEVAARWAKEMGLTKVYVLDDNEVYGRGIADMFVEACEDLDMEVVGRDSIDAKSNEFRSLMTTIKSKDPDLVYFGGTVQTKGGQIARDMAAAELDAKLMVPDGCLDATFIQAAGAENVNGRCYGTIFGAPPENLEGAGKQFVQAYEAKYGNKPNGFAIYAYEAAKVALAAIEDAGEKDRRKITDAALAMEDFEGALGTWGFDENGDTTLTTMSGNVVKDGEFTFVKLLGE